MSLHADLLTLRNNLEAVERRATSLPWSARRPWRCTTHLGVAGGLPTVDLHDLSVPLALDAVERIVALDLNCGGVVLITGRGRHTGGRSRLRDAVLSRLHQRGIPATPRGPGRVEVVLDPRRLHAARPGMGLLFWALVALLVVAMGIALGT